MCKLVVTLIATLLTSAAWAKEIAYVIDGDMGGSLIRYEERKAIIGDAKVIIDGVCLSACTMYLRTDWHLNVCYTDAALLGFHKPYMMTDTGPEQGISAITMSDKMWLFSFYDHMPDAIKHRLYGKQIPAPAAGDPMDRFYYVKARDMHGAIPRCNKPLDYYTLKDVRDITTSIDHQ